MKRRSSHEQQVSRIDPIGDHELIDDESEVGEEIRTTITALMPWGISILAHVGLIVIAFFLVWQTIVKEEHQPVVPRLSQSPEVSVAADPVEQQTEDPAAASSFIQPVIAPITPVQILTPGKILPPISSVVPSDTSAIPMCCGPGVDGDGVGLDRIGLKPKGSVKEVVFLIDASGSMVDVLPFVINELKQVVNNMQPVVINNRKIEKKATIIFFSGEGVYEVPGGGGVKGLRTMTPEFKAKVSEWVSLENFNYATGGRGSVHVEAALARALSYKPQLVIMLSDNLTGGGQGATQHELMQDDLLKLIHQHNKANPPAKINTIQFLYEDPLVRQGLQGTLNRIAEETGGESRFISQRDLNLR